MNNYSYNIVNAIFIRMMKVLLRPLKHMIRVVFNDSRNMPSSRRLHRLWMSCKCRVLSQYDKKLHDQLITVNPRGLLLQSTVQQVIFLAMVILPLTISCTDSQIQINKRTSGADHSDDASPPEEVLGASIEIECGLENMGIGCLMRRDGFHLDLSKLPKTPDFELYLMESAPASEMIVSDVSADMKILSFESAPSNNKWGAIIKPSSDGDKIGLYGFLYSNLSNPDMGIGIALKSSLGGQRRIAKISQCAMVSYLVEWGANNNTQASTKQVTAIPTDLGTVLSSDGLIKQALDVAKVKCEDKGALKSDKLAFQTAMKLAFYQWAIAEGVDFDAAFTKLSGK